MNLNVLLLSSLTLEKTMQKPQREDSMYKKCKSIIEADIAN